MWTLRPSSIFYSAVLLSTDVQCLTLSVKVLPVLDVADLGYEFLLEPFRSTETIIRFRDQAFEVIVSLLDLIDIHFLQMRHLGEPLKDNILLVLCKLSQLYEEKSFPHNVRLYKDTIYQFEPAS